MNENVKVKKREILHRMKKVVLSVIGATLLLSACSEESKDGKVAVVDLQTLYADFNYQQELQSQFELEQKKFEQMKDSLDRQIQFVEMELKNSAYKDDDKNLLYEQAYVEYLNGGEYLQFKEDSMAQVYTSQVWTQLNSYIESYGDENNYEVIIGMQGNGNVMYVKDQVNVTEDVIAYANKKYEGE